MINKEMDESLLKGIYIFIELLKGTRILERKQIYIIKFDKNSKIERFKV